MPQIILNFRTKSTGQLAHVTFILNWLGALARAFTVFVESDSLSFWFYQIVAITLTSTFMIQFYIYREKTKKVQY
jgi:hypothetical protein